MKTKLQFDSNDHQKDSVIEMEFLPLKGHIVRWEDNRYYRVSEIFFEKDKDIGLFTPVLCLGCGYEILNYKTKSNELNDKYE